MFQERTKAYATHNNAQLHFTVSRSYSSLTANMAALTYSVSVVCYLSPLKTG